MTTIPRIGAALCSIVIAMVSAGAAPKQAAPIPPLPQDLVQAVSDAMKSGNLKDAAAKIEEQLRPLVSGANNIPQPDRMIPLVALREFTRYFGELKKPNAASAATAQWLLTKPKLLETMMLAVTDKDVPAKVFPVLGMLRLDQQDRLEEYPDLTTAICVVWDQPFTQAHASFHPMEDLPDPMMPRSLMRYYVNARSQLRNNPQQLPWELSAYMVDNLANEEEIGWAMNRYAGHGKIGGVFFDVSYDYDMLNGTSPGRLNEKPYTLENILKEGGICGDQAYYAAQVARSVGVPAIICSGVNANEGTGHAWVGTLSNRGGEVVWDFEEGRYPENRYWKGQAIDPQTREHISDADISVLAELVATPARERMTSAAICKAVDMVSPGLRPALLMQAINLSPGNRRAWIKLAELAAQQELTVKQLADFNAVVTKFAVKDYPDFAFKLLMLANSGRGNDEQLKGLERLESIFNNRPDLQADIYIAVGDLYNKQKMPNEAYAAYTHVLDHYSNISPIVMEALEHVDAMLRDLKAMPQLADIYAAVWKRMPQPDSSIVTTGTAFYKVGERYEKVLKDLNNDNAAQNVRSRLDAMTATVSAVKRQ